MQTGQFRFAPGNGTTGIVKPENCRYYIQNDTNDSWLTIENRMNCNLALGWVSGVYGSISNAVPAVTEIIPALSLTSVPIDPAQDVAIGMIPEMINLGNSFVVLSGASANVNPPAGAGNFPLFPKRLIHWHTLEHGSRFSRPLYPLESCYPITRVINGLQPGLSQVHDVTGRNVGGGSVTLASPSGTNPTIFSNPPPLTDYGIMAVMVGVTVLGASSTIQQLAASYIPCTDTITTLAGFFDVNLFGSTAAAANPVATSQLVPIPCAQGFRFTNTGGTTNISLQVTYWIAMPTDFPQ
jgi:hypothetical protein